MADTEIKRTVGVLGGSFNPVHKGHTGLAAWIAEHGGVDAVWLSLSPSSPFKQHAAMLPDDLRLRMLRQAVAAYKKLQVTDVELSLPHPSYTADALAVLSQQHPGINFRLIIGGDNVADFNKWRRWEEIAERYGLIIYPRPGYEFVLPEFLAPYEENVTVLQGGPAFDVSSTEIRERLAAGIQLAGLLDDGVEAILRGYLSACSCRK